MYDNHYFANKEIVEDRFFWQMSDNPKETLKKYNTAKSEIARLAQNYPIQGSSADITKYACILFFSEILKRDWWMKVKIVNIVHDEIIIEMPKGMEEECNSALLNCMREAGKPFCKTIPLDATADCGDYWIH